MTSTTTVTTTNIPSPVRVTTTTTAFLPTYTPITTHKTHLRPTIIPQTKSVTPITTQAFRGTTPSTLSHSPLYRTKNIEDSPLYYDNTPTGQGTVIYSNPNFPAKLRASNHLSPFVLAGGTRDSTYEPVYDERRESRFPQTRVFEGVDLDRGSRYEDFVKEEVDGHGGEGRNGEHEDVEEWNARHNAYGPGAAYENEYFADGRGFSFYDEVEVS